MVDQLRVILFKNKKYYLRNIDHTTEIYDSEKNLLSLQKIKKIGFLSKQQFISFLGKISKKDSAVFLDEKSFIALIEENLIQEKYTLNENRIKLMLNQAKGLNYKIVKVKDIKNVLAVLTKFKTLNVLEYNYKQINLGKKLASYLVEKKIPKTVEQKIAPYLNGSYGTLTTKGFKCIPLLIPIILNLLD